MRFGLLLVLLMLPQGALAEGHLLSLGGGTSRTYGAVRSTTPLWTVEVDYAYQARSWMLGGGLRLATPPGVDRVPLEAYARLLRTARLGSWTPAVGLEVGLSGLLALARDLYDVPPDVRELEVPLFGPGYVAIHAAPLRFTFSSFSVSALEAQWGTSFPPIGPNTRLRLELLHVGVRL